MLVALKTLKLKQLSNAETICFRVLFSIISHVRASKIKLFISLFSCSASGLSDVYIVKLFKTNNKDAVDCSRMHFQFDLPSILAQRRTMNFVAKYRACDNLLCKYV